VWFCVLRRRHHAGRPSCARSTRGGLHLDPADRAARADPAARRDAVGPGPQLLDRARRAHGHPVDAGGVLHAAVRPLRPPDL
ncbi:MAG: hypothetical protein AVDCRST_MAG53-375, partial [uncultured Solirubrobacteraceae bacterium]